MNGNKFTILFLLIVNSALFLTGCGSSPTIHSKMNEGDEGGAISLIREGTDIDQRNHIGNTALHEASISGNIRIARELISGGANLNARNFDGRTPLMLALVNGHIELAKYYIDQGARLKTHYTKTHVLLDAAASGNTDLVGYILNNGFDIDTVDRLKTSALHIAAKRGNKNMVSYLLEKGISLDMQTDSGWSAMHFAALENHLDIITLLLASGAKPVDLDTNGAGAFTTAQIYEALARLRNYQNIRQDAKSAYEKAASFYLKSANYYQQYSADVSEQISDRQLMNFLALVAGATAASIAPGSTLPNASGGATTLYTPVVVPQKATGSLESLRNFFEQKERESQANYKRCLDSAARY
ncbi:MAG: ankyrin repeat domain-containing protein [Gammaproteobacteria bacterium]|nr:ankyrin repeat domain-containing protein [Gammaproteobacteria bacterium]